MTARPAAGGGRWVDVAPDRLDRWLDGFARRHGRWQATGLRLAALDGAVAELTPPPGVIAAGLDELRAGLLRPGRLGLLLARRGAAAVGVVDGGTLTASKVDTRYVQGRTAAGGWSQQRFARRRDNQARAAASAAADAAAALLLPACSAGGGLAALVTGGDRRAVDAVLSDPRLAGLAALRVARFLDVPAPRRATLIAAIPAARAVRVRLLDP